MEDQILILGLGNILMGDEGVGVHAIHVMSKLKWPQGVILLDGGTGGFHLMEAIEKAPFVIMIDATLGGEKGAVSIIKPVFSADFPSAMSTHDIGMKDLIEALIVLNKLPPIDLITISIDEIQPMQTSLSNDIRDSLPEVERQCRKLVGKILSQ
jgi:hydrogenase maturation protease